MKTIMNEAARWVGLVAIINVLHMSEQMLFGIGELATLKQILVVYYDWFQQPDYGTVVLVIIASTMLFSLVFAAMAGGIGRAIVGGFVGVLAISEVHHLIETLHAGHYTPGAITAIPYIVAGAMLFRALIREQRKAVGTIRSLAVNES